MDIQIKNITTSDLDNCASSHKDAPTFLLPTNSILKIQRTTNQIYIATMFLTATGHVDENTKDLNIKIRSRIVFQIIYFLGLIFILSFLFAKDVTLNGNTNPSFFQKLTFVSVGLLLWSSPILLFIGLKRDFNHKIRTIFNAKTQC